jgi:hypothetical protein
MYAQVLDALSTCFNTLPRLLISFALKVQSLQCLHSNFLKQPVLRLFHSERSAAHSELREVLVRSYQSFEEGQATRICEPLPYTNFTPMVAR